MGDVATTLDDLLDADLHYAPTYADYLSNHLSMALIAKTSLGAPAAVLQTYARDYVGRLNPRAAGTDALTRATWRSAIGHADRIEDFTRYFVDALADDGADAVLTATLPALVPGMGGGAFHGAIRLAYALEYPTNARIATALAYFASVAAPLGPEVATATHTKDAPEIVADLRMSGQWAARSESRSISDAMAGVAEVPTFDSLTATLRVDQTTPSQLAHLALVLFASSGDFVALHGVTGLAALGSLRRFVTDTEAFDRGCFRSLAAAFLSIGAPDLWSSEQIKEFTSRLSATRDDVAAVGVHSPDEHVTKLICSAHRRYDETADPLYLAVAAREAGLTT